MDGVTSFDGGSGSFRPDNTNLTSGSVLIAEWSDGMPLVVIKCLNGHPRIDLGFLPLSSDVAGSYWQSTTDGALLMANALTFVANPPDSDGDGIPNCSDTPSVHNLTQITDHFTLQEAIDASVNGDVIAADPGTYHEAINFHGLAITLRSTSGNPADTIIDGGGNSSVVLCVNGEGSDTILEGFTITGGNDNAGGGMLNSFSSPTVTHCIFSSNLAEFGGGMYNLASSPTMTNCTFSGNTANGGGGMYNNDSSPAVTHCIFSSNLAEFGGGMFNWVSSPTITNCTFSVNTANGDGGGMYNNDSTPTVTNCILWGNFPSEMSNFGPTPTVSFSDVQGGLPAGTTDGGDNIDADPLFVNAVGGNLRLQDGSPCIDVGDNSAGNLPASDADGNPRIRNGTVDMGAFEFGDRVHNLTQHTYHPTLQAAINAAVDNDKIEAEPGTYHEAINFSGLAITVRSASGNPRDTIIDGLGSQHVVQCVGGEGPSTVLSGFTITGGNSNIPGLGTGGGMYNVNSSPTVTHCIFSDNAASVRGGGMHNYTSSSPTVTHCIFSGNTANNGGGMYNSNNSSPTVSHCTFIGNTVNYGGGGMSNQSSHPTVSNCTFISNTSTFDVGGGMYNNNSSPVVTNCTFSGNTAVSDGGGMYNFDSSPTVTNCILWGDSPDEITNNVR